MNKNEKKIKKAAIESFFSSGLIVLTGMITIPLVFNISKFLSNFFGYQQDVGTISPIMAAIMSILFFIGRFTIYFVVRLNFDKSWDRINDK